MGTPRAPREPFGGPKRTPMGPQGPPQGPPEPCRIAPPVAVPSLTYNNHKDPELIQNALQRVLGDPKGASGMPGRDVFTP